MQREILQFCVLLIGAVTCGLTNALRSRLTRNYARMQQGVITSFAPIVEKVAPSVVTVFTTQTVSRGLTTFPFSDDTLRQFFGGQVPQKQGKQTLQGLGSGVISRRISPSAEEIMVGLGTDLRKYKAKKSAPIRGPTLRC